MARVTLKEVADAAGVSLTTASFALAGKGRISPDIRRKVQDEVERLGYSKPLRAAPGPVAPSVIGILFRLDPEWAMTFSFVRPILEGIDEFFSSRGHNVVLIPISEKVSSEDIFRRIDGLKCAGLFSVHYGNEALFTKLESRGLPVVLVMNGNYQNRFSTVCVDDFQGAYEGALHLLQAGHRKILFIDVERQGLPMLSVDRFIGFKKAIEEFEIPVTDVERLSYDPRDHEYLRSRLAALFGAPDHPTALFALDDELAARVLSVLGELRIDVPGQVSVIAPGDILDYSGEHAPHISTMQIDTALMGSIACGIMENRLNRTAAGITVLKVKQQLVLRGSTRHLDPAISRIQGKKPSQLSPREKAMAAFNHIDVGAVPKWLGASAEFLARLADEGWDEEALRRRIGDDFRYAGTRIGAPGGTRPFGPVSPKPRLDHKTLAALRSFPWPDPADVDLDRLAADARRHHEDFAVLGGAWSPFWHDAIEFVGTQDLYYLMYDDPEFLQVLLERIVDYYVAVSANIFEAVGRNIDVFFIGGDFGGQSSPLFTLDQFERFIVPPLKRLVELGHRYGKKVMLHSSGAIRPLIPSIIRTGVDALHGLQPDCAGMSAAGIKKDFGTRICLSGGIDAKELLLNGNPAEVRTATLNLLETFVPGGAYIASPSHERLLADTPLANVLALFDAVKEFEADLHK